MSISTCCVSCFSSSSLPFFCSLGICGKKRINIYRLSHLLPFEVKCGDGGGTAINSEKVTFPGALGFPLSARLDKPEGELKATALLVHCFTCSMNYLASSHISSALTKKGIAVLRFDFTGLGSSEGEFENTNFSSNLEDIKAAIDFLRVQNIAPDILIGHSLGGAAVLRAAEFAPEVKAIATINAPCDPSHLKLHLKPSLEEIESEGSATVTIAGRDFQIQKQFIDDLEEHKSLEYLKDIRAALLVFHSPQDKIVSVENARLIFNAARHPKSFISLYDADHLLTRAADANYLANILNSWVDRYLFEQQDAPQKAPAENKVIVSETTDGKYTQKVQIGRHTFYADELPEKGGIDKGPGPYELLLAGLGACTSMTLRMYADHKKLPLDKVQVTLTHQKVYHEDQEHYQNNKDRLDLINREITVEGDLTPEQRQDLLRIAEKCPVHKTLTQSSLIKTALS